MIQICGAGCRQPERAHAGHKKQPFQRLVLPTCSRQKGPEAASLRASRERQVSDRAPRWHRSASCTVAISSGTDALTDAPARRGCWFGVWAGCGGQGLERVVIPHRALDGFAWITLEACLLTTLQHLPESPEKCCTHPAGTFQSWTAAPQHPAGAPALPLHLAGRLHTCIGNRRHRTCGSAIGRTTASLHCSKQRKSPLWIWLGVKLHAYLLFQAA